MADNPTSLLCADLKKPKQIPPHEAKYILLYFCFHCTCHYFLIFTLMPPGRKGKY